MPWFRVDDGFANSKPVLKIPRRFRLQAVGLWVMAGTWSAKELTDGHIPDYLIEELAGTNAIAAHLAKVGLWETVEDGWRFVGWEKYQPAREDVLKKRFEEADRKRRWRESRSNPDRNSSDMTSGQNESGSYTNPLPSDAENENPTSTAPTGNFQVSDQREYKMSQRDNDGTHASVPHMSHAESEHPDPALPVPTRPDPLLTTSTNVPAKLERDDVNRICTHLRNRIVANGARKPNITKGWRDAARLLLDKDEIPEPEVHRMIDWCQDDNFWRGNILSMPKFREKYDTLKMHSSRRPSTSYGRPSIGQSAGQALEAGQRLYDSMTPPVDSQPTLALAGAQNYDERPF